MDTARYEQALSLARSGLSDREITTIMSLTAAEFTGLQSELQRQRVHRVAALRQRITKSALEGDPTMLRHLAETEVPPQNIDEARDYGMPDEEGEWISCGLDDPPAPEKFGESGFPPGHPIHIAYEQTAAALRTDALFWIENYRWFRTAYPDRHPDEFIRWLAEQLRLKLWDNGKHLLGFIKYDPSISHVPLPYANRPGTPEEWVSAVTSFPAQAAQAGTHVPPATDGTLCVPEEADPEKIVKSTSLNPPYCPD